MAPPELPPAALGAKLRESLRYELAELRDSRSRPTQAIATFEVRIVKQDGSIVQQGRKALLVSKVPLEAVAASIGPTAAAS